MVKYVTSGAHGPGEGRTLTPAEVDANFYELAQAVGALEAAGGSANGIASIIQSGTSLYVTLDGGEQFGPFALPVSEWNDRGEWAAATVYAVNDIVTYPGLGLYRVRQAHTSDPSFDPDAVNGYGAIYSLLLSAPNPAQVTTVAGASLVLTRSHANRYLRFTNASGCTIHVESGVFNTGEEIHMRQVAAGGLAITYGDSGTVINPVQGRDLATDRTGAVICLKCVDGAAGEFDLFGDLAETT